MNSKGTVIVLCTKAEGRRHRALAAEAAAGQDSIRRGEGRTREDAIAQAVHRARVYYADPQIETDILIAEARGNPTTWLLRGDQIERLPEAA